MRYINDSKGTNVGATLAAVGGLDGPLVLIAGGDGKGQDFAPLARRVPRQGAHAVLIGRDAALIETALAGICHTRARRHLEEAVRAAARAAQPGDTVLLSPACASLDMFRDYAQRGDVFAAAVQELPHEQRRRSLQHRRSHGPAARLAHRLGARRRRARRSCCSASSW